MGRRKKFTSMQSERTDSSGVREDEYLAFSNFYKQTLEKTSNGDNVTHDIDIEDFPRVNHLNIEEFQYYNVDKFNSKFDNKAEQISALNVNIRGITCNFDNFILYLNTLSITFDVISLSECHIQKNDLYNRDIHNEHHTPGYDKFYVLSSIKYGGVILYVKSDLKATYCYELTKTCDTHDSVYVIIDSTNLHKNRARSRKSIVLGAYYRHCKSNEIMNFISNFESDLSHKVVAKNDVIIQGDFNIDLQRSTFSNDSLCFLNTILSNLLEVHIFKPTRITYKKNSMQVKSATLIDQTISNLFAYKCHSGNLTYPDSDHHATFVIFETYRDVGDTPQADLALYRRFLSKVDQYALCCEFDSYDWDRLLYNEPDIDVATHNLNSTIQELCDKYAPRTKMSNRQIKYMNKP